MANRAGRLEYFIDVDNSMLLSKVAQSKAAVKGLAGEQITTYQRTGAAAAASGQQMARSMETANAALQKHGREMHTMLGMIQWRLKYTAISAVTYAGMAGIGAVTAGFVAATKAGIDFNQMMEQSTIAFTSMLGSMSEASDMLGRLYAMSAKSPFEFGQFVTGTQRLLAYGVAAQDVEKTLRAIGDATAAVGGTSDVFNRMSYSMGQMVSMGKITAREMREIAMAGVPAWQVLAEQMGKTVEELQKLSETEGIPAAEGIPALIEGIEERFGGMMEKMADTWAGLTTTIKDQFKQMMGFIEQDTFAGLKGWLADIRGELVAFNQDMKQMGFWAALEERLPLVADQLRQMVASLEMVGDAFSVVGGTVKAAWGVIPDAIQPAVVTMAQFALGVKLISKLLPAFTPMFTKLKLGVTGFTAALSGNATALSYTQQQQLKAAVTAQAFAAANQKLALSVFAEASARKVALGELTRQQAVLAISTRYKMQAAVASQHLARAEMELAAAAGIATTAQTRLGTSVTMLGRRMLGGNAAMMALTVALVAGGYAWMQYKKHQDEARESQERIMKGAETLVTSLGGTWNEIGQEAKSAAAQVADFAEANEAAIEALQQLNEAGREALLVKYAIEMQGQGLDKAAVEQKLQQLVRAAGITMEVPVGIDSEATLANLTAQVPDMAADLMRIWGESLPPGWTTTFFFRDEDSGEFDARAKQVMQMWAEALTSAAGEGDWGGILQFLASIEDQEEVFLQVIANFNELNELTGISYHNLQDWAKSMSQVAGLAKPVQQMLAIFAMLAEGKTSQEDLNFAMQVAMQVYQNAVTEIDALGESTSAFAVDAEVAAAATAKWMKELQAQYDLGSIYGNYIKGLQEAENERIAIINEGRQKAVEAQKKAIDERLEAELEALDKLRDARKDDLSAAEQANDIIAVQIFKKNIDAIDKEKEAVRDRAAAQKEGLAAVKETAKEVSASIGGITEAITAAADEADQYVENMTNLPEDLAQAIRDSGLSPEEKRKLAAEMVNAGPEQQRQAQAALARLNSDRLEAMSTAMGEMEALSAAMGERTVQALVAKLMTGKGEVSAVVMEYADEVANALNPILEALGEETIKHSFGRYGANVTANTRLIPRAQGGVTLPHQATIAPGKGRGLVQWAEQETGGEAFIPLAPSKRKRSRQIWAHTGRLLGVFAPGGILSPWEGMEDPSLTSIGVLPPDLMPTPGDLNLSMPYGGNLAMLDMYGTASGWLTGSMGLSIGEGTGYGGLTPTTEAVWKVVKTMFPAATWLGGRSGRPYKGSDHPYGRAFDFDNYALMDLAAMWLANTNPGGKIKYIIHNANNAAYSLGKWSPGRGWRPYTPGASVQKFAGESAWHRDHVHVSTYDQGGFLMPGLNLAFNGTGRPEPVLSMADGGFTDFTGGTKLDKVTYTPEQEKAAEARIALYGRAEAAITTFGAKLKWLEATGASAEEQIAALNVQIEALTEVRDAKQEVLDLALAMGATDEEVAGLRAEIYNLDVTIIELGDDVNALKLQPFIDEVNKATTALGQFGSILGILGDTDFDLTPFYEGQAQAARDAADANIELMNATEDMAEKQQYGEAAVAALTQAYQSEKAALDYALQQELDAIDAAEEEWRADWQSRYDAVQETQAAAREAFQDHADALREQMDDEIQAARDYWDDRISAMRDAFEQEDRMLTRRRIKSEMQSIYGQAGKSESDVERLVALRQELIDKERGWQREDAISLLEQQRDAALEALEAQKEALEKSLEMQQEAQDRLFEAQVAALDAEREEQEAFFEGQREEARAYYQQQLNEAAVYYANAINIIYQGMNNLAGVASSLLNNAINAINTAAAPLSGRTSDMLTSGTAASRTTAPTTGAYQMPAGTPTWGPKERPEDQKTVWNPIAKAYVPLSMLGEARASWGSSAAFEQSNPKPPRNTVYYNPLAERWQRTPVEELRQYGLSPTQYPGKSHYYAQLDAWTGWYWREAMPARKPQIMPWISESNPAPVFDQGGWLPPGVSTVANFTGLPELVLPASTISRGVTNRLEIDVNVHGDGTALTAAERKALARELKTGIIQEMGRQQYNARYAVR